ncbi:hypothetical protein EV361DRAFT_941976 [Lentinula raphanica]|uniref:Uncharacterized protein n=1 Tax=Lentinula raphanica TaxID=153919 RepID=A0AA38NYC4_9AGAR|nr:hypothetical protein F5878DRAFT_633936 [Lentinula raphanica]KAJ3964552.1 hypothetical protein EV361DRAFT_941976 [Lentinula raphanica]
MKINHLCPRCPYYDYILQTNIASAACSSSNVEVRNQTSRTSVKPKELRKSGSSSSSFPLSSAFSSAVEDFLVVSGVYSKSSVLGTEEAVVAEVVSFCVIGRISGGSLFGNAGLDVLSNACVCSIFDPSGKLSILQASVLTSPSQNSPYHVLRCSGRRVSSVARGESIISEVFGVPD